MNSRVRETDRVAILVAVYNGEKYLDQLINSLLKQDHGNIEIHIRDNCSTDSTPALLQKWQKRFPLKIRLHQSEENVGVIGNFGALLENSNAPYIAFCDCDDFWLPNKISKTLAKMRELEKKYGAHTPLLVHTDLIVADENLKLIDPSFWQFSYLNTHDRCQKLPCLLVQNQVTGCTMLINRALKEVAVPIPLDCVMHDWWIALVAACFGAIDNIPQSTLLYRQHSSNDTGAKPYGIRSYLKHHRKRRKVMKERKTEQVRLLIERYGTQLSGQKRVLLEAYLGMQKASIPRKLGYMFRYGFFKSGLLRNFILDH
ncbi:MAG: glycosyltransferase family 2 protein [Parachlamydiaceae bacterium]|nr:glycosyltransferase family 2 protein [Parachlamydiaceae bacterium]